MSYEMRSFKARDGHDHEPPTNADVHGPPSFRCVSAPIRANALRLRRDYEIALLDSGVSRAEAAHAADSFLEYINLVNEMVENDLRSGTSGFPMNLVFSP